MKFCGIEREDSKGCGPNGRYFVPKKTMLRKILGYFGVNRG